MASSLRATMAKRSATACWLHATDQLTVEVLAQVDYDAFVIDCQHGMADASQAVGQLRALQAMSTATPLVRVTEVSAPEIGRFLDAGFAGVICPMINTKAEAEALVAACNYAPVGCRSWGPTRAVLKNGGTLSAYHDSMTHSSSKPIVLAMIETAEGYANLDDILGTGIDGVFIGPMDLSLALGEPCAGTKGKKTKGAIAGIVAQSWKMGKVAGIYVADRESAEQYIARGFQFVVSCHDKIALLAGAKSAFPQVKRRVRTTHVGSLPRPEWLVPIVRGEQTPPPDYEERLHKATIEVMQKQIDAGLDEINDGELGRKDYVTAAQQRMSGFGGQGLAASAADLVEMKDFSKKHEGRKGLLTLTEKTEVTTASCSGPISYTSAGLEDLKVEITRVKKAADELGIPLSRVFFSSPSPGTLAVFFGNTFFQSHEEYVQALAAAMKSEYRAIVEAGFKLQVDCPDLAMGRHTRFAKSTVSEFREAAQVHVRCMNMALEGLDSSNIRMHVCWGNYPGPHHHDVALADIADIIVTAHPKFISLEACNPGHAHEAEVWKNVKVPSDKVFMPGVLDTTTSHIENPRLVAQRLQAYAQRFGMDHIMACTDCGFSTAAGALNLTESIVWAKMASMVKGSASVADSSQKEIARMADTKPLACVPGHERSTTLFFGNIVSNPDHAPFFADSYGYNMTYNAVQPGNGNALQSHPSVQLFVALDKAFEFTYGSDGQSKATLRPYDLIAVPAGVKHTYKHASDSKGVGHLLTVLPGQAGVQWHAGVVEKAKENGASCTEAGFPLSPAAKNMAGGEGHVVKYDSGSTLQLSTAHGHLQISWLHMKRGQVIERQHTCIETVAIVLSGSVSCGEKLNASDIVKQPSFLAASEASIVLLIESSLPHALDYLFDA